MAQARPEAVSVADGAAADALAALLATLPPEVPRPAIVHGETGAMQIARAECDRVVSAIVGTAGLSPTLAAVEAGRDVALANKEALVMAGALVTAAAARSGSRILPVDSEHSALHQLLAGRGPEEVARLVLTASGGPFLDASRAELEAITPERARRHPRWEMGAKISVDSSTLLNKGLEVMEAAWLFGLPVSRIGVVIHPEAIVHGLVEMTDGTTLAQLAPPDMALPIGYALGWPERVPSLVRPANLASLGTLSFREPDDARFPALGIAARAAAAGGTAPTLLVAADEVAVEAFLAGRIPFSAIPRLLADVLESEASTALRSLEDVREAERAATRIARQRIDGVRARRA